MDYKLFRGLILEELDYLESFDIGANWDLMKASGALVTLLDYVEGKIQSAQGEPRDFVQNGDYA